jgi:hypothetical protein
MDDDTRGGLLNPHSACWLSKFNIFTAIDIDYFMKLFKINKNFQFGNFAISGLFLRAELPRFPPIQGMKLTG